MTGGIPISIARYLKPREIVVAMFRNHPASLIPATSQAVGFLAAGLVVNGALADSTTLHLVVVVPIVFAWARLVSTVADWSTTYVTLTSERFIIFSGFFNKKFAVTPLSKLSDISIERHASGRLFGHGTLVAYSGGIKTVLATSVPFPEQIYLLLAGLIDPSSREDEDDYDQPAAL